MLFLNLWLRNSINKNFLDWTTHIFFLFLNAYIRTYNGFLSEIITDIEEAIQRVISGIWTIPRHDDKQKDALSAVLYRSDPQRVAVIIRIRGESIFVVLMSGSPEPRITLLKLAHLFFYAL